MLPLFLEVDKFSQKKVDDDKVQINFNHTKKISLPLDIIAFFEEETLVLSDGREIPVANVSLKSGKDFTVKQSYEEIKELVEEALPSHLKKESWE